ncbi:Spy/CpxP family protein refolding chaperone [Chromatiaceae bacterium AAb-1]|nr:Spy/CpxP family protein refolding chaperone [Chromatiaceae bacterium AAb-1]
MKATYLILALGVTLGVSGLAMADNAEQDRKQKVHVKYKTERPVRGDIFRGIELTDAQKQQVRQILEAEKPEREARKDRFGKHQALQALVNADYFDETAVRQALEAEQSQQLEQRVAKLKVRHQLYQVLTPEQKTQLAQQKTERQQKFREHRKPAVTN